MKRIACVLPAVLLLAGCPEREPLALSVTAMVNPLDGCIFSSGAPRNDTAVVDLVSNYHGVLSGFEFQNLLPSSLTVSSLSNEAGQLEANNLQLTGALITYRLPDALSVSLPDHFVPTGQVIDPGAKAVTSVETLPAHLVQLLRRDPFFLAEREISDPVVAECLASRALSREDAFPRLKDVPRVGRSADILVNLQLEGITQSGVQVLSNDFQFTIRVCVGCLVFPGADATAYLLAREEGLTFCSADQQAVCRYGANGCEEQVNCIDRYNDTDQAIAEKLLKCAEDTTFPNTNLAGYFHPLCKDMPAGDSGFIGARYQHLACLYGLEKSNAYCASSDILLFPPQE